MPLRLGIDLVHIPRVQQLLSNQTALERIFTAKELKNKDPSHLAGILALKEAVFKALDRPPSWQEVEVSSSTTGRPIVSLSPSIKNASVMDASVSHEGGYAVGAVIADISRNP